MTGRWMGLDGGWEMGLGWGPRRLRVGNESYKGKVETTYEMTFLVSISSQFQETLPVSTHKKKQSEEKHITQMRNEAISCRFHYLW